MILIATTESVGIGINLTNSDTIVYVDEIFDDKKMKQANDRVYRIGQKNNVQIITLLYENTIDMFVDEILESKKDVVDDWYNAEEPSEDLRDKFMKHLKNTIGVE
jgi:SNF2 family DNA or RNA helicase